MDSKTDLARDEVGQQADAGEHGLGAYAALTQPVAAEWPVVATGHARWEKSARVAPRDKWDAVSQALLRWEVATHSGFSVHPGLPVAAGHWPCQRGGILHSAASVRGNLPDYQVLNPARPNGALAQPVSIVASGPEHYSILLRPRSSRYQLISCPLRRPKQLNAKGDPLSPRKGNEKLGIAHRTKTRRSG